MMLRILFFLPVLIIIGVSPKNLFSQKQVFSFNSSDTGKTVAIYSSKKSFFTDYPIDTLVSHLNSLNTNPNITYYTSTEDHSKTGFYADYLIDLDVWLKMLTVGAPRWETVQVRTPENVRITMPDGTYSEHIEYFTRTEERYVDGSTQPGQGEIRIKIIEKRKNEKVSRKLLSATNNKEQGLKLVLIIELIEFLLGHFSN